MFSINIVIPTYHTLCLSMLSGFTLLDYSYLVKNLHGIQLSGIMASQLPNQIHSSIGYGKDFINYKVI